MLTTYDRIVDRWKRNGSAPRCERCSRVTLVAWFEGQQVCEPCETELRRESCEECGNALRDPDDRLCPACHSEMLSEMASYYTPDQN